MTPQLSIPSAESRGAADVLRLFKLLGLALTGLLLWAAFDLVPQGASLRLSSLELWGVAAGLGWILSRQNGRPIHFSRGRQAGFAVLWTAAVSTAAFLAVGRAGLVPLLLIVHLLWFLYTLIWYALAKRLQPPLRIGIDRVMQEQTEDSPLILDRRVEYFTLGEEPARRLSEVDLVLVQPERTYFAEHQRMLRHAQIVKVPAWSKTMLDEELTGRVSLEMINRDWLDAAAFHSLYVPSKRAFDIAATLLALPLLLPLLLVVALLVRLNGGAPILFWQERVGKDGRAFKIAKFRTMTRDSERSGPAFAKQGDLRVTPLGGFLRKFRLDELPQFWNVLRGEMSIIGPRPEQWAFAADFEESIPLYACRHWVRPGITGWAQVNQGYTDNLEQTVEKLQYDFYYVKNMSFGLDLIIVGKTIRTVLNGFGSR